jgi:dihydrofolate reductase
MTKIAIIAAIAQNNVIGHNNQLPWHLPADLQWFKAQTLGKPIIMGRKTFESLGRALPKRHNIVITRQTSFVADNIVVCDSLDKAIIEAKDYCTQHNMDEIMIIGGAEIYKQALDLADTLYITHVDVAPEGDTYFPKLIDGTWDATVLQQHAATPDNLGYRIVHYNRLMAL